jgi:hypothetical protein
MARTLNQIPSSDDALQVSVVSFLQIQEYHINSVLAFGQANERIARTQETYVASATSSWLESLERSLAQMKEYQVCRNHPLLHPLKIP